MPRNGGWIPPSARTQKQRLMTGEFHEQIRTFSDVMEGSVDEPVRVVYGEMQIKATGKLLPRIWQKSGSCVGAGGCQAYGDAIVGDVVNRGNIEEIKLPFPWATYGVGRKLAGMNGPGEGSFGGAQSEAVQPDEFGYLPIDDERVPQPMITDNWAIWSAQIEKDWSHPSVWKSRNGVTREELQKDADDFGIHAVTRIRKVEELKQAMAQGFGITQASMMGSRGSVVRGDVAIWNWDDQWAHQMSKAGYWDHPQHGLLFWTNNQWGPMESVHTPCPTMSQWGIVGGAWETAATTQRVLDSRDAEVYAHSNTGGFPTQKFDWDHGWNYG